MEWSLTVRPIVAELYKAGVIGPANLQSDSQVVSGMATANKEPHRPDKLDLFVNYEDHYGNFKQNFPPAYVPPSSWPHVLPRAKSFAAKHPDARFALLRLWSTPHYYPLMVGPMNRGMTSFLDSMNRSWEFKFKFGDKVMNRGDLILVMGEDEEDLFKFCTAVTFALQTKPWLREVDLWKSFINVDMEFLEGLDEHWLE
ncbi:mfs allantoate protein [Fusarium flagelliforme]|uniref:Mfs allantoate protein n=1 Tax=Fusarium flagelliforme TaxID=2675880 RepID=A0A395MW07_9HYPO|nr:mfs allantoate protein [Fusarium flagelliforme]